MISYSIQTHCASETFKKGAERDASVMVMREAARVKILSWLKADWHFSIF